MRRVSYHDVLPWLGLACILCAYIGAVVWIHPTNLFGYTNDDMMYFSSAKALAQGRGYILPSLPGAPPATKYPVLLPWILSFVWRWNPSFPNNLADAIAVIVAFGYVFLVGTYAFLRKRFGMGEAEALVVTGFCALQPTVLLYSSSILSDIPFAALAIFAMLLADKGLRRNGSIPRAATSGILSALSILMRATGVPFAAGLFLFAVWKRAWRQAVAFAAAVAPVAVAMLWRTLLATPPVPPAMVSSPGPGWNQSWIYYTSYTAFRRLDSPDLHAALILLLNQFLYLVAAIPGYFLSPLSSKSVVFWLVTTIVVLWMTLAGMLRQGKNVGWSPAHFALGGTILVVLSWDFPDATRFLIPFLPLFVAWFWLEAKKTVLDLRRVSRESVRAGDGVLANMGLAAMGALLVCITVNFVGPDRAELKREGLERASLLLEKREAYDWIRRSSPPDARVIAGEDACLYLYAGREAMAPIIPLHSGAYDSRQTGIDLNHITDVAQAIGASYWLASTDDSDNGWKTLREPMAKRLAEVEAVLPELFQSSGGRVRVYGLGCIQRPQEAACHAVDAILFPTQTESHLRQLQNSRIEGTDLTRKPMLQARARRGPS
jgi:hypothetical protein